MRKLFQSNVALSVLKLRNARQAADETNHRAAWNDSNLDDLNQFPSLWFERRRISSFSRAKKLLAKKNLSSRACTYENICDASRAKKK